MSKKLVYTNCGDGHVLVEVEEGGKTRFWCEFVMVDGLQHPAEYLAQEFVREANAIAEKQEGEIQDLRKYKSHVVNELDAVRPW